MPFLPNVLLASTSPRRRQLLTQIGATMRVVAPTADESIQEGELPEELVERLAHAKAASVFADAHREEVVVGSDTIVVVDGEILGKPEGDEDARRMLRRLSGRTHTVFTGYALLDTMTDAVHVAHVHTDVTFRHLEEDEIDQYVATGSSLDKAGAYGIQDDFGAVFIERIDGDYYTVMGLPLSAVYVVLRAIERARRFNLP